MYEAEQEALAKRAKLLEEIDRWENEEQRKLSAAKMVCCANFWLILFSFVTAVSADLSNPFQYCN